MNKQLMIFIGAFLYILLITGILPTNVPTINILKENEIR